MYIFTLLTADCSYSQACCKGRGELAQPHVGRRAARAGVGRYSLMRAGVLQGQGWVGTASCGQACCKGRGELAAGKDKGGSWRSKQCHHQQHIYIGKILSSGTKRGTRQPSPSFNSRTHAPSLPPLPPTQRPALNPVPRHPPTPAPTSLINQHIPTHVHPPACSPSPYTRTPTSLLTKSLDTHTHQPAHQAPTHAQSHTHQPAHQAPTQATETRHEGGPPMPLRCPPLP